MFCISLPLMFETEAVLRFWLGENYPEYAPVFFRLSIVATLVQMLGNTGYTACMATGNIKKYTIVLTLVGFLAFPITWIAFKLGAPAEAAYITFIIIYALLNHVRLIIMKGLIHFPTGIPFAFKMFGNGTFLMSIMTMIVCVLSSLACIYLGGLTVRERNVIRNKVFQKIRR